MSIGLGIGVQRPKQLRSIYSVGGKVPGFTADFIKNYYSGHTSLSSAITHVRNGNATMTDGYGPELVVNGGFDGSIDGWTADDATISWDSGRLRSEVTGSVTGSAYQAVSVEAGKTYVLTSSIEIKSSAGISNLSLRSGTDASAGFLFEAGRQSGAGRKIVTGFYHSDQTRTIYVHLRTAASGGTTTIWDSVSVREMPVIKWAPHNLLSYSEEFDNADWDKATSDSTANPVITANQEEAPDGTTTADLVELTAPPNSEWALIRQTGVTITSGAGKLTQAVWFKAFDASQVGKKLNVYVYDSADGYKTVEEITLSLDWQKATAVHTYSGTASNSEVSFGKARSTAGGITQAETATKFYIWGAHLYRSDLGGMVDNPERGDSYVPTALRPTGSSLVTNGDFATDSDWTKGAGWSISNGVANINNTSGSNSSLSQLLSGVNGETYEVSVTVSNRSGGASLYVYWGNATQQTFTTDGTYTFDVTLTLGSNTFYITANNGVVATIDNISVRKSTVRPDTARYLPRIGHHVYNGSAWVNEGLLAESEARTNLLTYSNDFTNSAWTAGTDVGTLSLDSVGPDGQENSAVKLIDDGAGGSGFIYLTESVTVDTSSSYTWSLYAKKDQLDEVLLYTSGFTTPSNNGYVFNLTNGTVSAFTGTPPHTPTIQDVGNGWYRCAVTFTTDSTDTGGSLQIYVTDSGSSTVSRDGTSSILIYGSQFEKGSTPSSFIPTDAGASVTRAAESFTIPSANLPWPEPNYIGSELVTNGTFDTDSDWTLGTNWSITGGQLEAASTPQYSFARQTLTTVVGNVYEATVDCTSYTSGNYRLYVHDGSSYQEFVNFNSAGTYTFRWVAHTTSDQIRVYSYGATNVASFDNVSVREIDPLSVSIATEGRVSYADEGVYVSSSFFRWTKDANDYIEMYLDTFGVNTGRLYLKTSASGTVDYSGGSASDFYDPDVLVPFNISSRIGSTFMQAAGQGNLALENTTPTALPDLDSNDLSLAYDYMGTISSFRVWDRDITDDGLVEATNPSLEPSLSLTFEGTGTNSFIVNDWSE